MVRGRGCRGIYFLLLRAPHQRNSFPMECFLFPRFEWLFQPLRANSPFRRGGFYVFMSPILFNVSGGDPPTLPRMYQVLKYRGEPPEPPCCPCQTVPEKYKLWKRIISKLAFGIFKVKASKLQKNVIFYNLKKSHDKCF